MATPPAPSGDEELVVRLGLLLRLGSFVAALVLVAGGMVYLARHGTEPKPVLDTFMALPPEYSRPLRILEAAWMGSGRALIQLGLLVLIATPILRVAYSAAAFVRRRDWLYAGLTLLVLGILALGVVLGRAG